MSHVHWTHIYRFYLSHLLVISGRQSHHDLLVMEAESLSVSVLVFLNGTNPLFYLSPFFSMFFILYKILPSLQISCIELLSNNDFHLLQGLAAGVLCKFSKEDGWIPVNKNLWWVSATSSIQCLSPSLPDVSHENHQSLTFFQVLVVCFGLG